MYSEACNVYIYHYVLCVLCVMVNMENIGSTRKIIFLFSWPSHSSGGIHNVKKERKNIISESTKYFEKPQQNLGR